MSYPSNYYEISVKLKHILIKKILNEFVPEFLDNELRSFLFNHFGIVENSFFQELLDDITNSRYRRQNVFSGAGALAHNMTVELIMPRLAQKNAVPFIEIEEIEWKGLLDPKIYRSK